MLRHAVQVLRLRHFIGTGSLPDSPVARSRKPESVCGFSCEWLFFYQKTYQSVVFVVQKIKKLAFVWFWRR